jgi:hypothetical protein
MSTATAAVPVLRTGHVRGDGYRRMRADPFALLKLYQCVDYADCSGMIKAKWKQHGKHSAFGKLLHSLAEGSGEATNREDHSYLAKALLFAPISRRA